MTSFDYCVPLLLLALGLATPAGASDYQALVDLFEDWRAFERPPLLEGAPDHTRECFAQRQPDFLEMRLLKRELDRAWSSLDLEEHRNRHLPPMRAAYTWSGRRAAG